MQHQSTTEKVVISLSAYRRKREARAESAEEERKPDPTAPAIEKLAYHLLMAVRAAKELS
jgi:hypothetical protein